MRSQVMLMLKSLETSDIVGNRNLRWGIQDKETAEQNSILAMEATARSSDLGFKWFLYIAPGEMGLVRHCCRKEMKTSTGAAIVEMEKKGWMWNATQMEFPSSAAWVQKANGGGEFGLWLLLWMILLRLHGLFARVRGQLRSTPLPLLSCHSGWLFRASSHLPSPGLETPVTLSQSLALGPQCQLGDEHGLEIRKWSKSSRRPENRIQGSHTVWEKTKVHKDPLSLTQHPGQRCTVWI